MNTDYDSIMMATDSNVVNSTPYYKEGVALPDNTVAMKEGIQHIGDNSYVAGGLVLTFFILAAVICKEREMLLFMVKDIFSSNSNQHDEGATGTSDESLGLFILTLITAVSLASIYVNPIMEACSPMSVLGTPYWLYAAATLAMLALIYFKLLLYKVVNWVFFSRESGRHWTTNYMCVTALTALLVYPIALVSAFCEESRHIVIWALVFVFILYKTLLFLKLLANFKVKSYGYLLIFLYFCSVELMPAVVTWQMASYYSRNIIVKNLLY